MKDGEFRSWYRGSAELVKQARRQVAVADGAQIVWSVAEGPAADAIRDLLEEN